MMSHVMDVVKRFRKTSFSLARRRTARSSDVMNRGRHPEIGQKPISDPEKFGLAVRRQGTLRNFGLKVGVVSTGKFEARIRELVAGSPRLALIVESGGSCGSNLPSSAKCFSTRSAMIRFVGVPPARESGHLRQVLGKIFCVVLDLVAAGF
jgi:hypothetical protein